MSTRSMPELRHPTVTRSASLVNRVAVAAILGSTALVVFGTAAVNMALPALGQDLGVSPAAAIRVTTAYQATLLMALLPCAAVGTRFGLRPVFVSGVALFVGASISCAVASSLNALLCARALQGIGAAAILSLAVALLRHTLPQERFAAGIAWNAMTVAVSTALAPAIGALLLSVGSWRLLFLAALPMGVAIFAAVGSLPAVERSTEKLDIASMGLNALMFGSLVFGAEFLPQSPTATVILLLVFGLALVLLARREFPKTAPLVPLDLLRLPSFQKSVIASVCCFAGQTAGLIALPFLFQNSLAQPIWMVGVCMTSWPLTVALAGPVSGRLAGDATTAQMCGAGGAVLAAGLAIGAVLPLSTGPIPYIAIGLLCGTGWSLFQVANNRSMFLAAPLERSAAAGGLQGTARLLGQALGALLLTLLFTWTSGETAPRIGLAFGALLTAIAATVSWRPVRSWF